MSILYLLTAPGPVVPGSDAAFQEISALRSAFNGEMVNLCPRNIPGQPFPPQLFGFHRLAEIWRLEQQCDINHVFHSVLYPFPVLRFLKKPTVYTVLTSLSHQTRPSRLKSLARLHRIVVSNTRDADVLKSWGLSNYVVVPPAIGTVGLVRSTLSVTDEMTLLMASAPWVEDQFDLKGVDALLDVLARDTKLRLILIWRGLLLAELLARVERRGIGDRVEIVTGHVKINDYLARAHATVLAAKRSDIVKAYPHSLLESLIAGKPVILSDALPMADYVRRQGCGIAIGEVSEQALLQAIDHLRAHYDAFSQAARLTDAHMFSQQAMIECYRDIYRSVNQGPCDQS